MAELNRASSLQPNGPARSGRLRHAPGMARVPGTFPAPRSVPFVVSEDAISVFEDTGPSNGSWLSNYNLL